MLARGALLYPRTFGS